MVKQQRIWVHINVYFLFIYCNIYFYPIKWKCHTHTQHFKCCFVNLRNLISQSPVTAKELTQSLVRMIANHCFKVCHRSVVTSNLVISGEILLINCTLVGKVGSLPFFLHIMFADCINVVIEMQSRLLVAQYLHKTTHMWYELLDSCYQLQRPSIRNTLKINFKWRGRDVQSQRLQSVITKSAVLLHILPN